MGALPPIAVIAGGLGTRLYPITKTIPKSLVDIAGESFLDWQLRLFARRGITRVVLCVGHFADQIEDHLKRRGSCGLDVQLSYDGDSRLGTGGAVRRALPLLGDDFLVTYGDSYLDIDYRAVTEAFRATADPALMTVFRNEDCWDHSNVEFDGTLVQVYDKSRRTPRMAHIDYGLLAMRREAFDPWLDHPAFDLADLLGPLASAGRLVGFEVFDRFYEIGSVQGIADLERYLAAGHPANRR